ncbi:MAG: hypothetical protein ACRDSP_18750 [Pseudonocardiaceae bacterium]
MALSPNGMFAVGIAKAGLLRIPAAPELVFEFLRVVWRTIQHYGVEIDSRRYNGPILDNGYRNTRSPYGGVCAGRWPLRVNDDDVRVVYFQDPDDGSWHELVWEHAPALGTPFSAEAAAYARRLAASGGRCVDPHGVLAQVLARWSAGEVVDRRERRMAVRLSAERSDLQTIAETEAAQAFPVAQAATAPGDQPCPVVTGDDDDESEIFDDARHDWHANFGIIATPQLRAVREELELIVASNRQDPDRVRGAAVIDGHPGLGKTTIVNLFGRDYHRHALRRYGKLTGDGHEHIPVFRVGLTSNTTLRTLNKMILWCRILGHCADLG